MEERKTVVPTRGTSSPAPCGVSDRGCTTSLETPTDKAEVSVVLNRLIGHIDKSGDWKTKAREIVDRYIQKITSDADPHNDGEEEDDEEEDDEEEDDEEEDEGEDEGEEEVELVSKTAEKKDSRRLGETPR